MPGPKAFGASAVFRAAARAGIPPSPLVSRKAFREKFYDSVEALQKDLDGYLRFYNNERPHQGYRNMGKRPVDTIEGFVKSSGESR